MSEPSDRQNLFKPNRDQFILKTSSSKSKSLKKLIAIDTRPFKTHSRCFLVCQDEYIFMAIYTGSLGRYTF